MFLLIVMFPLFVCANTEKTNIIHCKEHNPPHVMVIGAFDQDQKEGIAFSSDEMHMWVAFQHAYGCKVWKK